MAEFEGARQFGKYGLAPNLKVLRGSPIKGRRRPRETCEVEVVCSGNVALNFDGVRRRNSVWGLRRYAGTAGSAGSRALRNTASCRHTRAARAGTCRRRWAAGGLKKSRATLVMKVTQKIMKNFPRKLWFIRITKWQ